MPRVSSDWISGGIGTVVAVTPLVFPDLPFLIKAALLGLGLLMIAIGLVIRFRENRRLSEKPSDGGINVTMGNQNRVGDIGHRSRE